MANVIGVEKEDDGRIIHILDKHMFPGIYPARIDRNRRLRRDGFGTTSTGADAGMEQVFGLSTLGGFLPFTVRLGIAVPLQGKLTPALYVGFSL